MFSNSKHKGIRQLLAAFVALVTAFAVATPAFATSTGTGTAVAATQDAKATIVASTGNEGDTLGAFKIVDVTYANNQLTYAFTSTFQAFLDAADASASYKGMSAEDYTKLDSNDAKFKQMLGDFSAYVKANKTTADYTSTTVANGSATFENVPLGQYVIVGMGNVKGAYIYSTVTAEVVPYVDSTTNPPAYKIYPQYTVDLKTTTPGGDKTITAGTTKDGDKETASVGDVISFQLSGDVPTYPAGTTNKTLFMKDTLSAGLTLNPASVKVYGVKGEGDSATETELAAGTDYTLTIDGQSLYVDYKYDQVKGYNKLHVKYDATLNEDAKVGTAEGNPNDYKYVYSNNPFNGETHDHKDVPDDTPGYGEVSDKKVVYTYGLYIHKTDAADATKSLQGATFELKSGDKVIATLTTDANGYASYNGLEKGEYTLHETQAPTGYKLADDVKVTVSEANATSSATSTTNKTYSSTKPSDDAQQATNAAGVALWVPKSGSGLVASATNPDPDKYEAAYLQTSVTNTVSNVTPGAGAGAGYTPQEIKDNKGGNLPTTGGMGLTLIYGAGAALVACFIVMEARKKAHEKA